MTLQSLASVSVSVSVCFAVVTFRNPMPKSPIPRTCHDLCTSREIKGCMVSEFQSLVPQAEPKAIAVKFGMWWRDEYRSLYAVLSIARKDGMITSRGVWIAKGAGTEVESAILYFM
jgi:hypothetical protein